MIINNNAFSYAIQSEVPFKYSVLNDFIPKATLIELYQTIPTSQLDLTVRETGSDKTYHLYNCLLVDHVTEQVNRELVLSENWQRLLADLQSHEYKEAVSHNTNINVNNCFIQIMLKVYKAGSFISMHTDDEEVALTHLNFMNPYYDFNNKGDLYFHDKQGNKVVSIPPNPDISILLPRASESFHSVDPCVSEQFPKITMQVVFWKTKKQRNLSGRNYL